MRLTLRTLLAWLDVLQGIETLFVSRREEDPGVDDQAVAERSALEREESEQFAVQGGARQPRQSAQSESRADEDGQRLHGVARKEKI